MKKIYLFLILSFVLVGCGSKDNRADEIGETIYVDLLSIDSDTRSAASTVYYAWDWGITRYDDYTIQDYNKTYSSFLSYTGLSKYIVNDIISTDKDTNYAFYFAWTVYTSEQSFYYPVYIASKSVMNSPIYAMNNVLTTLERVNENLKELNQNYIDYRFADELYDYYEQVIKLANQIENPKGSFLDFKEQLKEYDNITETIKRRLDIYYT